MERRSPTPIDDRRWSALDVVEPGQDLAEWRWRAYTDHLTDLGYDLAGGSSPSDAALADAVERYPERIGQRD